MRAFYAKQKISYLWKANNYQTCETRTCYLAGHLDFVNPFFRNRKCLLWTCLTVLSKLFYNVSTKFSNYLQIPGYLLHFIPTIIDIIIFRQVDNKRFNFIIKYMVHNTKLFFSFNPNFQWIYFLYILFGLIPRLLMAYLYRECLNKKEIQLNLCSIFFILIFNEFYLFA